MKFSAGAFTQRFLMFERECGNWQKRYLHFFVPANAQKTIFETAMKKNQKSAAIGFIFITLLIDITGWGIVIPVVPALIRELIHNPDLSVASQYGGWLSFVYAGMQFVFASVLGGLSDKYGRRPIILFSLLGDRKSVV